ncbi:MAG: hypothetical protein LBU15_02840 [Rickettsiales bacterium]|jgi:hypothetical protein|nr:hypothetical protein [Rickettsiales bacterium]
MARQIRETFKTRGKALAAISIIGVLLAVHGFWLFVHGNKFRAMVSQKTNKYSIGCTKVFVRPTLFGAKNTVLDLKISLYGQERTYEIIFKKLVVRSSMLSRRLTVAIPEGVLFSGENSVYGKMDLVDDSIVIRGKKGDLLAPEIDMKAREIRFLDGFCVVSNFSLITTSDLIGDHIELSLRTNADSVNVKRGANSKQQESNFELVLSNSSEVGSDKKILSADTKIEKFTINDITNNYGISVTGSFSASQILRTALADIELKLINFNSLMNVLSNSEGDAATPDRKDVQNIVQFLSLIPGNEKDSDSLRYYRVVSDFISNRTTVNGTDIKTIATKFMPISGGDKEETGK